jgi:hypothetical protein
MDQKLNDDWLDERLRDEAAYIDDAGFTANVLRQLPAARQRRSIRAVILLGISVLAAAITYVVSGDGWIIMADIGRLAAMPMPSLVLLAIACGILVTAGGVVAALSKTSDRMY